MNRQHPEIELYINAGDDEQNAAIQEMLNMLELDQVVENTLFAVGIAQQVMLTLLITDEEGIRDLNNSIASRTSQPTFSRFLCLRNPWSRLQQMNYGRRTMKAREKNRRPSRRTDPHLLLLLE